MLPTFLFTAVNRAGKNITERVEAENLAAARYKLEIQSYSNIEFFESELSNDVKNLFEEKQLKNASRQPLKQQLEHYYKTGWKYTALKIVKVTAIYWLPWSLWAIYSGESFPIISLAVFGAVATYFLIPAIIYDRLMNAHFWAKNQRVKFWGNFAKIFNLVSINKIPRFEIDVRLACAEAREGDLTGGLNRLAKHQNDPKISKRLFSNALAGVYTAAKKYDEVLAVREDSLREGNVFSEELMDYAVTLALHHKKTTQAKEVVERVLSMELNVLALVFLPFCQGVIETEDGNLSQAEFYLRRAAESLKPFEKNSYLDGLRCLVKAFLAISLGNQGDKTEADKLFQAAKPYLLAHKEFELLQRCETAVN